MIFREIACLVNYGLSKGLIKEPDRYYATNAIIDILGLQEYEQEDTCDCRNLKETLGTILDWAVENGVISDYISEKDLLDTKLMGVLTPSPSEVNQIFEELKQESPQAATDYFYSLAINSNYIRSYRIKKDIKWVYSSPYGDLDITINLSKPEKDPKAIAAAKTMKQSGYPKCLLCKENIGYKGHLNHPARQNLRAVPVQINGEEWYFQYSPYVYYNEHCIILNGEHVPMKIDKNTFRKLLDFIKQFPHYFVGSNADLPIVGGSILTHDHFQGGNYSFAMEKAPIETVITFKGFEDITAGIVNWPMSVIRLSSNDDNRLIELANKILTAWRGYTDESAFIFAETEGEPHNTITPIARRRGENYELDLVLRNNITTQEHPMGVYHPHAELHHIKKENIGLIEVMGLAVLPSRLKYEMSELKRILLIGEELPCDLRAHEPWARELINKYKSFDPETIDSIINEEIGLTFMQVLEHAGVYKCTESGRNAFCAFIKFINN